MHPCNMDLATFSHYKARCQIFLRKYGKTRNLNLTHCMALRELYSIVQLCLVWDTGTVMYILLHDVAFFSLFFVIFCLISFRCRAGLARERLLASAGKAKRPVRAQASQGGQDLGDKYQGQDILSARYRGKK